MSALDIKDSKGKSVGKFDLKVINKAEPLMHLLHKAVVTEEANRRQGTQKTKTRSEVSGGGRKPYKQKKTGNARQGSIRAPHYAHGSMALALMPRDYTKGFNKKERRAAILGALNAQISADNVILADKIAFNAPKTKDAAAFLAALGLTNVKRVLVVTNTHDEATFRSFRNIPNVEVRTAPSREEGVKTNTFSTRDLLVAHKIVIAKDAMETIESFWGEGVKEKGAEKAAPKAKAVKAAAAEEAPKPKRTTKKAEAEATAEEAKPKRTTRKKTEAETE